MADTDPPHNNRQAYWRENLRIMTYIMAIWFFVSFGCGILFVEQLNKINLGGFQFGFWMAQQGSIYVFVILIFIYVRMMNNLDKKYSFTEMEELQSDSGPEEEADGR
ncbi:MAG: DUF4212 domain-containing protein [Verrucomicrobiota bacterium]|nr:DUF4212 domain-containing protein [Verrucomicrobiota bacterium]